MRVGETIKQATGVSITYVRAAQPAGQYKTTGFDIEKAAAEFLLTDISGSRNVIVWRDGRTEKVTDRSLQKLQAAHTWATDF